MPEGQLNSENGGLWLGGANTSLEPEALPAQPYPQYAWGINVDNSRGQVSTRDGNTQLLELPGGKPQMLAHFRTTGNFTDYSIAVVSGRVYACPAPFTQWRDLGVTLDANVDFCTFEVVERGARRLPADDDGRGRQLICPKKYIIIQDGINTAVAWDGKGDVQRPNQIPIGRWMAYVNNRLFVAVDDEIFWSDVADPFSFYKLGFLAGGGQWRLRNRCTGLTPAPDGQSLLAFEADACWRFLVGTPIKDEAEWKRTVGFQSLILQGIGCLAGNSFVHHYGDLWWWSNKDLMSLRRALAINSEDELADTDLEMTRSRVKFGAVNNNVVGCSHLNYLLINTPINEIWVKNNSPASLLNQNTSPAWMGVWTGLRVKQFASFYANGGQGEQLYTLALSRDSDNKTRIWRMFNGTQEDNGKAIKWSTEFKAHTFGTPSERKRMRWFDFSLQRIWGDLNITGFFKGLRGGWKQILTKEVKAARDLDDSGNRIVQYRRIYSQEVFGEALICSDCGVESDDIDQLDVAFQIMIQGEGIASIDTYRIAAFTDAEAYRGKCEENELDERSVVNCGNPQNLQYQPTYNPQTVTTATGTFKEDPCSPGSDTITVTLNSAVNPPTPTMAGLQALIQGAGCPCEAVRTYESTQSYTASCVTGQGPAITKTASATSSISQTDADDKALSQAKAEAEAELICSWTSTQEATAMCPQGTPGLPVTRSATYVSTISQADADANALAMAQSLANAALVCGPSTAKFIIGGLGGGDGPNPYNLLRVNQDGSPSSDWQGSSGPNGVVYDIEQGNGTYSVWVCGQFNAYMGDPAFNLVKIDPFGNKDPFWTNSFVDGSGNDSALAVNALDFNTGATRLAIVGLFTSWRGVTAPYTENFIVVDPSTGLPQSLAFPGVNGLVRDVIDNNGGWIIVGDFTLVGTTTRPYIARVNGDGSLDTTWLKPDTTTDKFGPDGPVDCIVPAGNGMFVSGRFSKWAGQNCRGLAQLIGYTASSGTARNEIFSYQGVQVVGQSRCVYDAINNKVYLGVSGSITRYLSTGVIDPLMPSVTFTGDVNKMIGVAGSGPLVLGTFRRIQSQDSAGNIVISPGEFAVLLNADGTPNQLFNFNETTGRGWFGNALWAALVIA